MSENKNLRPPIENEANPSTPTQQAKMNKQRAVMKIQNLDIPDAAKGGCLYISNFILFLNVSNLPESFRVLCLPFIGGFNIFGHM